VRIDSLAKDQLMQSQPLKPMLTQKLTLSGGDTVDMDGHITVATAIVWLENDLLILNLMHLLIQKLMLSFGHIMDIRTMGNILAF